MTEPKDPSSTPGAAPAAAATPKAPEVSRRGFLAAWSLPIGWTAFSAASASGLVATARFMFPNILIEPPTRFKDISRKTGVRFPKNCSSQWTRSRALVALRWWSPMEPARWV